MPGCFACFPSNRDAESGTEAADIFDAIQVNDGPLVHRILAGGDWQIILQKRRKHQYCNTEDRAEKQTADSRDPNRQQCENTEGRRAAGVAAADAQANPALSLTPLQLAAGIGQVPMVEILIQKFNDLPDCNRVRAEYCNEVTTKEEGLTALHLALNCPTTETGENEAGSSGRRTGSFRRRAAKEPPKHRVMVLLLRNGADANAMGELRNIGSRATRGTALHMACAQSCDPAAVKLLLENGANVNARARSKTNAVFDGATPLHLAVSNGLQPSGNRAQRAVTLLLSSGGDCYSESGVGTPLHVAASEGSGETGTKTAKALIERAERQRESAPGSYPSILEVECNGQTPLECAVLRPVCDVKMVRTLCNGDCPIHRRAMLRLIQSIRRDKLHVLKSMLDMGVRPDLPIAAQGTPAKVVDLQVGASATAATDEGSVLLEGLKSGSNADLDAACNQSVCSDDASVGSNTVCSIASSIPGNEGRSRGPQDTIGRAGPRPEAEAGNGYSSSGVESANSTVTKRSRKSARSSVTSCWEWVLQALAGHVHTDPDKHVVHKEVLFAFCRLRLSAPPIRVVLNGRAYYFSPALFALRYLETPMIMDTIARCKARVSDCYVATKDGRKLWHNPFTAILERTDLSDEGNGQTAILTKMFKAVGKDKIAMASEWKAGQTPLHTLRSGHERLVTSLISFGCNVEARDKDGNTPLASACSRGEADIARMLIMQSAKVNTTDVNGRTPLHLLACASREDITLARSLVKAGMDPTAKDNKGLTPLDIARENGYFEFAAALEKQIEMREKHAQAIADRKAKAKRAGR